MQYISTISKYLIIAVLGSGIIFSVNDFYQTTYNTLNRTHDQAPAISISHILPARLSSHTVWQSMAATFQLDHQTEKSQVKTEIRKLLADQNHLYEILQAAGPYIYFIFKTTESYHLPGEMALIPFIESEFNPNDRSHKGATGLWQLMPQTARELGVKVKSGYDGRRNVIASTKAALTYLNDLININKFRGDWYLALAAYNAGPGKVISATRRSGTHTFWNLQLPRETKLYVPKLLAVAAIIKEPEKYGVELPPISNEPYFTEVTVKNPVTLNKVAESTGVNLKTLRKLNPDIKHKTVPIKNGEHKVLVPIKQTNKDAQSP